MKTIEKFERDTQDRVIAMFHDEFKYRYHGTWTDCKVDSKITESLPGCEIGENERC